VGEATVMTVPPVLSSIELVLGRLYLGPATTVELRKAYRALEAAGVLVYGGWEGVEAVVRGLTVQGLVSEQDGRLVLDRDQLHPRARRIAELIAGDLERAGVV